LINSCAADAKDLRGSWFAASDCLQHPQDMAVLQFVESQESFIGGYVITERAAKLAPDLVVVDPPRAGLGERTARALGRMTVPRVTYVSCDPATLSRDLRILLEFNFRVEQVHLLDMFPQTFHMETVLHLAR